jgi:uncharacterized RDD family membrane protein YckC
MSRLLSASTKGAGRMAQATGVDRALDDAVEEAIVRALRNPAIGRAIERAIADNAATVELTGDDIARIVKQVLESEAADQVWAEVLASRQAQMLVERIAGAPELRAAIAAQSAGLVTDIGVKLTRLTEALDDAMERMVRPKTQDSEIDQAGLATRLVAAGIDLGLLFLLYSLASTFVASVIPFAFGGQLTLVGAIVLGVIAFLVAGGILSAFWALAGQTPGMHFLSIRLIHDGSPDISARTAIRRVGALLVSVIPFGLGFLAILRDPQRRAWHDRMTGTEVVYESVDRRAPYSSVDPAAPSGRRASSRARSD